MLMNITTWRTILWQQFGAAVDMLDNALRACPDELWCERLVTKKIGLSFLGQHNKAIFYGN